jgi:folate-dependent phosphoribosylglycinamide formyltransferase PurN
MKWVAFFSQTGSEIVNISKTIGKWPDVIVTNKQSRFGINDDLLSVVESTINRYVTLPEFPKEIDYLKVADILGYSILDEKWQDEVLITLHGYLRILPPDFTTSSNIYNGHPGLITKHPNLKGLDPQKKAWNENHIRIGCVIHRVIPELDSGEVVAEKMIHNNFETFVDMLDALHVASSQLWINFLNDRLRNN